jgi:hypothetical protein
MFMIDNFIIQMFGFVYLSRNYKNEIIVTNNDQGKK